MSIPMPPAADAISVLALNKRLSDAIALAPDVRNVWVVGETSDVRVSGGHCYLELVEKGDNGVNVSRIRAIIWANTYRGIENRFRSVAGMPFASGIKIRACVTASYHPTYGMSVTVSDVDPAYTAGDAIRRRAEIVSRLTVEGIIENNRRLPWALVPNRVAIVSARNAAGYGDFMTHLFGNTGKLRFKADLFEATLQGERTVPTILNALQAIAARSGQYDAVVIIRGGGATTDLAAFDDYSLAAAIATFPLPVIIGIGHERDVTVLDYVAAQRVKTPTAAAEFLIERVGRVYDALGRAADKIYQAASSRIALNRELLAHASASLPGTVRQTLIRCGAALDRYAVATVTAVERHIERNNDRLERAAQLLAVLSPEAVLARGFSLTMLSDGKIVRSVADVAPGQRLITRVADGTVTSTASGTSPLDDTSDQGTLYND